MDSLIVLSPKSRDEISSILKPYENDSISLRYIEAISNDRKYILGEAYALIQLGSIFKDQAKYPEALELYQQALHLSVEVNSIEFRTYTLNKISSIYSKTEAVKSALDYSQNALELAETVPQPSNALKKSIIVSLNNIGATYQMLEQYNLAIEKYERSMTLEKELDDKLGLAINHKNLGVCYEALGKLEPALKNFRKSLVYYEIMDSNKGKITCNYNIAHVYVHQGKIQEAIDILQSNLLKAISLNDNKLITTIYINLGWAFIRLGDYNAAETNLEAGLALAKSNKINEEIAEANKFLSELWIKRNDYQKGMSYYKDFKKYEERITSALNLRYVNDMILRYESEMRENQLERLAEENESVRLRLRKKQDHVNYHRYITYTVDRYFIHSLSSEPIECR